MPHAHKAKEEVKKHGDELERAMKDADQHNSGQGSVVPAPDNGGHARSVAAHLDESAHMHNNNLQGGHQHVPMTNVNALRQPPQEISRAGKQHRGQ